VSEPEQEPDPVPEPEQESNEDDIMSVEYKRKREIQEKAKFTIENTIEKTEDFIDDVRLDRILGKDEEILDYLHVMRKRVEELKTLQDRIHRDNITKEEATQILNEAQALSEEIKDLGNHILEEEGPISLVKFEDWN
jgi:hypothetical protein